MQIARWYTAVLFHMICKVHSIVDYRLAFSIHDNIRRLLRRCGVQEPHESFHEVRKIDETILNIVKTSLTASINSGNFHYILLQCTFHILSLTINFILSVL